MRFGQARPVKSAGRARPTYTPSSSASPPDLAHASESVSLPTPGTLPRMWSHPVSPDPLRCRRAPARRRRRRPARGPAAGEVARGEARHSSGPLDPMLVELVVLAGSAGPARKKERASGLVCLTKQTRKLLLRANNEIFFVCVVWLGSA